jgi:RNA polymerase sigma factor (sigma-70 family)
VTKEKLRSYRAIRKERDLLNEKIKELEVELYDPRAQRIDGMPRSGSNNDSTRREAQIDRKDELLALYREKERELTRAILEIEEIIDLLQPRERTLLRLYYIDGLTWEQVACEMNYSWRQVHRIHGEALTKLKATE